MRGGEGRGRGKNGAPLSSPCYASPVLLTGKLASKSALGPEEGDGEADPENTLCTVSAGFAGPVLYSSGGGGPRPALAFRWEEPSETESGVVPVRKRTSEGEGGRPETLRLDSRLAASRSHRVYRPGSQVERGGLFGLGGFNGSL